MVLLLLALGTDLLGRLLGKNRHSLTGGWRTLELLLLLLLLLLLVLLLLLMLLLQLLMLMLLLLLLLLMLLLLVMPALFLQDFYPPTTMTPFLHVPSEDTLSM